MGEMTDDQLMSDLRVEASYRTPAEIAADLQDDLSANRRLLQRCDERSWENEIALIVARHLPAASESDAAEGLRALSDAATPGPWVDSPGSTSMHHVASIETGHEALGPFASTGWVIADLDEPWQRGVNGPPRRGPNEGGRWEAGANARFIVAAVNYVRSSRRLRQPRRPGMTPACRCGASTYRPPRFMGRRMALRCEDCGLIVGRCTCRVALTTHLVRPHDPVGGNCIRCGAFLLERLGDRVALDPRRATCPDATALQQEERG